MRLHQRGRAGKTFRPIDGLMLPRRLQLVPKAAALLRLALAVLLSLAALPLRAQSFTATVDRNAVPVGESLTLTLTFDGVNATAAPTLPPLPNFTILPSVSQRNEISFANGQQTMRFVYDYQLQAAKEGDVVIPPFQASIGGRVLSSQPISLKVLPASAAAAAQTNLAFVKLVVGRKEVYVGEPFPVEMHLYWQNAKDVRIPQLRADGFSMGQGPKPGQSRTQIGNVVYNLVIFKMSATAARAGQLTLGPAETSLTLLLPVNNPQARRDPFGFFGGQQYQERPANIASEALSVRVLPLPRENVPDTFNGVIGNFQVSMTAAPTTVGVGDPITMRIQIAGRGPLESITLPAQPDWRDFNSYPATAKVESNDELGLSGVKNFEQVIVPQNHELKSIPPFRFTYFDSQAKAYVTRTTPAIPLTVKASATAATPLPSLSNSTANASGPRADDIIHIRPRLEMASAAAPVLLQQRWFLWLQGVPVALWLTLLLRRKRNESLANNPRLRRQREVAGRIRDGLRDLRAQAEARKSDEFFATLFRLLQEQIGERLDLPASAITESVVDERLRSKGARDETLRSLHELFQACNLARYAPLQSSQELSALIPKLESALKELREIKA